MAGRLTAHDRAILAAVRQTRVNVEPSDPRWTHPLARMMALALGFDPDSGEDFEIRTTKKFPLRDLERANGSTSKTSRRRCG